MPFVAFRPFNMTLNIFQGNRVKIWVDNSHLYTYIGKEDLLQFHIVRAANDVEMVSIDTWCLPGL